MRPCRCLPFSPERHFYPELICPPTFLAFAGFSLAALAIGHLLGGPDHRLPLAIACATRHINLALGITAGVRGPKAMAMAMVCVYLIVSLTTSLLYSCLVRGCRDGWIAPYHNQ